MYEIQQTQANSLREEKLYVLNDISTAILVPIICKE
jgi:hypothetical protein